MIARTADNTAVLAEVLYLVNLLLAPGFGFLGLLWLAHARPEAPELGRCHLRQAIVASLWAAVLLLLVALLIVLLGGLHSPYTWMVLLLYFISCHTALILFGVIGLARAMAGQLFVYPLIGSRRW